MVGKVIDVAAILVSYFLAIVAAFVTMSIVAWVMSGRRAVDVGTVVFVTILLFWWGVFYLIWAALR